MALGTVDGEYRKYCPLILQHQYGGISDRAWRLSFQLNPEPKIILEGVQPTYEEIIACLSKLDVPSWVAEICLVAAATATKEGDKS